MTQSRRMRREAEAIAKKHGAWIGTQKPVAIDFEGGLLVLGSGEAVPITRWCDLDGEDTADRMSAAQIIAGPMADGTYLIVPLCLYNVSPIKLDG